MVPSLGVPPSEYPNLALALMGGASASSDTPMPKPASVYRIQLAEIECMRIPVRSDQAAASGSRIRPYVSAARGSVPEINPGSDMGRGGSGSRDALRCA